MAAAAGGVLPPPFVSETARERETLTFDDLGITTAALGSPSPVADKLIPTSILSSTPDPALTAFAQLGLYRLNATHSIVSLFDRTYQHFVAEAIRCAPLCPDELPTPEGRRVFCGTAVPRAKSICEHVLTGPAEDASISRNGGQGPANLPVSVIPNLDLDSRFCYLRDKNRRFYAGVPIRSPSGINIGVYCVLDNKPRPDGLTDDQIQFVRDISQTVMDYLHAKRSNEWYRREERMVRGLGSFVEGQATLSNWSDSLDNSSFQDIPGVQEGALNKRLQAVPHIHEQCQTQSEELETPISLSGFCHSPTTSFDSLPKSRANGSVSSLSSSDMLLGDVERVFSKACNIIRESIEVEGVLYLDASVRTFGGLVGKEVFEPPILERVSSTDSSSDESQAALPASNIDQQHCSVLGFSTSSGSSINGHKPLHGHTVVPERLLQRLLQRYPHGRIFNFEPDGLVLDHSGSEIDDSSSPISPLSVGSLHPFGPDEEHSRIEHPRRSRNHQNIASCLLKMFPGARSLAFVPLFDGQKHRWFAGGFVWTKTPTRIFTVENDLSYLRVFGLATMAEVGRLNTKAADKTKTDILGSISHELRSPLHGVVGSVELLRNTVLDVTQENILRTIETSGRTLLDTIDHLLDYSKVNNIVRSSSRAERRHTEGGKRSRRNTSSVPTLRNPALCVHLDRLAEEVIESVLAGWSYRNMSDAHFAAWHNLMQGSPKLSGDSTSNSDGFPGPHRPSMQHGRNRKPVQIYLDIDHTESWSFRTHPGAFRRIVLNLFGNALKFTKVGFIRVSMKQERGDCKPHDGNVDEQPQTKVILTVSDSGKGISQEYLKSQLFTPFSQEDHFAPGTGLGLSLVRQMVVSLGGSIDVLSQVGQGTTMTVSLPLSPFVLNSAEAPAGTSDESDTGFSKDVKDHLTGKRIHLVGFDEVLTIREGIFGQDDSKQKSQVQLLESICRGWLKMDIVLPRSQNGKINAGESTNLAVVAEEDFVLSFWKSHAARPSRDGSMEENQRTCPRLVVCRDSNAMYALTKHSGGAGGRANGGISYIAEPIGPRKLAEALVSSRLHWTKSQNGGIKDNNKPLIATTPAPPSSQPPITTPLLTRPRLSLETVNSPPQRPIAPINGPSTPVTTRSILVVDDNPINLKILAGYMLKLGHPHVSAMNGLEAMQTYTSSPERFRCIVTDISMPTMDGLESTRRIREFERAQKLKPVTVIALTGLSGEEIQQDAFVSGVDLFLTRPVVLSGLKGALEATGHGGSSIKEGGGEGVDGC